MVDGCIPSDTDQFEVITYTSGNGEFATFAGPDLGEGRTLVPEVGVTAVFLKVAVPQLDPTANDDPDIETNEDTEVPIDVLANDTDPNGDALTITQFSQPTHGSVVEDGLGNLIYTPANNLHGIDSFSYEITDGQGTDTASVTVNVTAVADVPNLSVEDTAGSQDTVIPLVVTSSLNDTDGSESLAIVIEGVPSGAVLSAGTETSPGTHLLTPSELTGLTIAPPAGSDADFVLTVTAQATEASNNDIAEQTGAINVMVIGNAPPVADAGGPYVVDEDGEVQLDGSESTDP